TGTAPWQSAAGSTRYIRIGVQLLDANGKMLDRDFARCPLDRDVPAGAALSQRASFNAPTIPGRYVVKCDLVAEGRTWFEETGTIAVTHLLDVEPRT
ncbi:MAG: hypothetical protein ACHQSE_15780, partial [Gemmatimonadales bacterium]